MTVVALVVAAGRGTRMGHARPKQYLSIFGQPLLRWTLRHLEACPHIDHILTIIHPDDKNLFENASQGFIKVLPAVMGGAERQDSVRHGLEALTELNPSHVLIHDAARPILKEEIVVRLLEALKSGKQGVLPALQVVDTLKRTDDQRDIRDTVPRTNLWRAQTPQAFTFNPILTAHRRFADTPHTDDAGLLERLGHAVHIVEGSEDLMKVTEPSDIPRLEATLMSQTPDIRTGMGFDVHALEEGDHVTLCGVQIAHTHKLKGHSDADVALHALTDALLGAIGSGDIGDHFPPSDPQWKGAASHIFLTHARDLIAQQGGLISHVDLTLMCEAPKIGPHRDKMRQTLADLLHLSIDRVSVKATTTEKLGFTGRGEGIAAQAIATVRLPLKPPALNQ